MQLKDMMIYLLRLLLRAVNPALRLIRGHFVQLKDRVICLLCLLLRAVTAKSKTIDR